jgi:transposase-like protein
MPAKLLTFGNQQRVMCMRCHIIIGAYPMPDGSLTCPRCKSTYSVVQMEI